MMQKVYWYGKRFGTNVAVVALGAILAGFFLTPLQAAPATVTPYLANSTAAADAAPSAVQPLLLAQAKKDDELLGKDDDDDDDDDLLKDDDDDDDDKDLLKNNGDDEKAAGGKSLSEAGKEHAALFAENRYPSATTCGTCHPRHFEE